MSYASTVLGDSPAAYWPLNDTSGTTAIDATGNGNAGTYQGTVTLDQPGGIPGTTCVAQSSSGYVSTTTQYTNPVPYSFELWCKTTVINSALWTFANTKTTTPADYDRNVYLGSGGKVNFTIYNSGFHNLQGSKVITDGNWHHIVCVMDSSYHMYIYVDGALDGSNTNTLPPQTYNGYWRIGEYYTGSANVYFGTNIQQAAYYPTALTSTQIANHYTVGQYPLPSVFTMGSSCITTMLPPNQAEYQANLFGVVNPNGSPSTYQFIINTNPIVTSGSPIYSPASPADAGSGTAPVTVTTTVNGLTEGPTYYFALEATTSGTAYGGTESFVATIPASTLDQVPLTTYTPFNIPHFAYPFSFSAKEGPALVEQNSGQEIFDCVAMIVNTTLGQVPEVPYLGIPNLTFSQVPLNIQSLVQTIQAQEPRATVEIVENVLNNLDLSGDSWRLTVDVSAP